MPRIQPISLPASYDETSFSHIQTRYYERDPSIVVLTLYRPQNRNAFTTTMMLEMEEAFGMFDADDRVKCVVLTGHGSIFCAGADLDVGFGGERREGDEGRREHRDGGGRVALAIHHCRKPTIAAINGHAVGIGITMTLPCNIRVTHKAAKIGFVFSRRGLVMEACSSYFLPRLIGHSRAMHAITTGAVYAAAEDVWSGLFAHTVERPEDVLPRALQIAADVAGNTSLVSTYLMKELMYRDLGSAEATHLLDSRILYDLFQSADNKEGVRSFMEKRDAKFDGTLTNTTISAFPWWMPVDAVGRAKVDPSSKPKI